MSNPFELEGEWLTGNLHRSGLKTVLTTLILTITVIGGSAALARQQPLSRSLITAARCQAAPVVDGDLGDAAWQTAGSAPILEPPDHLQNRVYACWDADKLYLAVWCQEPHTQVIVAPEAQRDDGIYGHESVEIFLAPEDGTGRYFHLIVSAANVQRDEKCPAPGSYDASWNAAWDSAVQVREDSWQVEVAIPFAQLETATPRPGERWGMNICRNRYNEDKSYKGRYSWSPLIGNEAFHRPDRFGLVRFSNAGTVAVERVGDLFTGRQSVELALRGMDQGKVVVSTGPAGALTTHTSQPVAGEYRGIVPWVQRGSDGVIAVEVVDPQSGEVIYASGHVPVDSLTAGELWERIAQVNPSGELLAELQAAVANLESSAEPYAERVAQWEQITAQMHNAANQVQRLRLLENGPRHRTGEPAYGIGMASTMSKILPRHPELARLEFTGEIWLQAACNEMEAAQVVIYSPDQNLRNVRLNWTDLHSAEGNTIPRSAVSAAPVGFVKTQQPPYEVPVVGWWPDPILTYLDKFDVAQGDLQPVWFSVRVPSDVAPGIYWGELTIRPVAAPIAKIPVKLEVWDFTLPAQASLRTALSTRAGEAFDRFLAQHRCNPGSIYRRTPPDEKTLARWPELEVTGFNILQIRRPNLDPETLEMKTDFREKTRQYIAETLALAEKYGIADRAYVYMFDESGVEMLPAIEKVAAWVQEEFPGLYTLTTARDNSYGTESPLKSIKGFCPLTPYYNAEMAEKARQQGHEVWWYVCCGPGKPYANLFIEYPAIDPRLLMGFMAYAYHPDGFLYYRMISSTNNAGKQLTGGPYTDWNPRSWTTFNGDGHMFYPGQNGPISSIRMENWLDGMEDYEYLKLLEQRIEKLGASGEVEKAEGLNTELQRYGKPGNELVKDLTNYTLDPEPVEQARRKLARLILEAGK